MSKGFKIIPGAPFFKFPFLSGWLVQAIKLSLFWTMSLVLLLTFKRLKLEMPDWSHLKDLFKIFPTGTNFFEIHWKTTQLSAVKHEQCYEDFGRFSRSLNFSSILFISLVLLITFEQIKLEMPDWSHLKDLFKIFPTVTNFFEIHWKTTKL